MPRRNLESYFISHREIDQYSVRNNSMFYYDNKMMKLMYKSENMVNNKVREVNRKKCRKIREYLERSYF